MSDTRTHIRKPDGSYERTEFYYDKRMSKLCGANWKKQLVKKSEKRNEVLTILRNKDKLVRFITGTFEELLSFKTEMCYIILQNNKEIAVLDDSILVKLNFDEIESVPDTDIETVFELEKQDYLWLELGTIRNNYVGHQIMRLVQKRTEAGKMTFLVQKGKPNKEDWELLYKLANFVDFLQNLAKTGGYILNGFK